MELSEYIYANRQTLEREGQKRRAEERNANERDDAEERVVDIYDSADSYRGHNDPSQNREGAPLQNTTRDQHAGDIIHTAESPSRTVAVCLGLLCVLLLAGIIGLGLHCRTKPQTTNKNCSTSLTGLPEKRQKNWRELYQFCKAGCSTFNNSFYYISTQQKPWEASRQDCIGRGADLVIINSREEQAFINSFKKKLWIGLSVRNEKKAWRWVDGTLLDSTRLSHWSPGEPTGTHLRKTEDCVETYGGDNLKSWNDNDCDYKQNWVCEKVIDC